MEPWEDVQIEARCGIGPKRQYRVLISGGHGTWKPGDGAQLESRDSRVSRDI